MKRYYTILGVAETATKDEIRAAYRKLALECHPDRNPGDKKAEEKFRTISEAYDILADDDRRRKYDTFGEAATPAAGTATEHTYSGSNLDDLFAAMAQVFGSSSPFANRTTTTKRSPKKKAANTKPCQKCNGDGMIGTDLGFFMFRVACPACLGTGRAI